MILYKLVCKWGGLSLLSVISLQQAGAQATASPDPAPVGAAGTAVLPGDKGSTTDKHAFGVLPNYRTAEGSAPFVPLTTKQKFTIATKDSLDGPSYVLALVFSGFGQLANANPSFGQGVEGFAHRYGTALADQDIGNFLTEAILPSLLHEDPRFFRKGSGSKKARVGYALARVLVARNDKGMPCFNAPEILGNGIAAAIGNLYYPDDRGFGSTMQRAGQQIGTDAVSEVLKEFWPDVKAWWQHRQQRHAAAAGF